MTEKIRIVPFVEDKASVALGKINKKVDGLGNRALSAGKKLAKFGVFAGAAAATALAGLGVASIKMAMDAVESENLFEVAMGGMADSARKWSEDLRNQLGLNSFELRKNVATFNQMFTAMGLGEQASFDMATGLTELANDMASFFNLRPEEAFDKLRAGITGETEPLKRLGILVDEQTVKQAAMDAGLIKQGETLTQQQKVQARYLAILNQTSNAQGDLARTMDSPTNKLRVMRARLNETGIEIGMVLLPTFQKLLDVALPALTKIAKALPPLVQGFLEFGSRVKQIVDTFMPAIRNTIGLTLDLIHLDWGNAFDKLKDITKFWMDFMMRLTKVFGTLWKNAFRLIMHSIKTVVVKGLNSVIGFVESGLNKLIDLVNKMLARIERVTRGRVSFGRISQIAVPRLALPERPELEELPKLGASKLAKALGIGGPGPGGPAMVPGFVPGATALPGAVTPTLAEDIGEAVADKVAEAGAVQPVNIGTVNIQTTISVPRIDDTNIERIADKLNRIQLDKLAARTGIYVGGP